MKEALAIPHDIEAEQAVLGAIIEENDIFPKTAGILTPNSFYKPSHQHIFRAFTELASKQLPIDEVILGDQLRSMNQLNEAGGYAYLAELVECVPEVGNIIYYAKIIQENALLRDLIQTTTDIGRKARDPEQNVSELLAEAQHKIISISGTKSSKNMAHIKDVMAELFIDWEEKTKDPDKLPGIPTRFGKLDNFIGGLIPSDLIIVAARPKMGKTAFAMNIVENVNLGGVIKGATAVFSLEMSKKQIANRLLTSNAKVDNKKVKFGNLEQEDWNRLSMATDRLSTKPIYIDRDSKTVDGICAAARLLNLEHEDGLGLVVVDYLQLMIGTDKSKNREQEIAEITRRLKGLAIELDIPVIALSQLNRALEKRSDKRPELSDLRESGAIEQDANIIIFIYRDEIYDPNSSERGIAEIIIKGHREGPTGTIRMGFEGKYTKFFDLK